MFLILYCITSAFLQEHDFGVNCSVLYVTDGGKGFGSALGACRVFVMTRHDTPEQSTQGPPATRVIFMVEGDGSGCERQEEDIWL